MARTPDEPYGFEYEHDGSAYAFHIVAGSREEAEARFQSMKATAICLGRLCSDQPASASVRPRPAPIGVGGSVGTDAPDTTLLPEDAAHNQ